MDACADPTMARILADAPAVLGIEACRALDAVACAPLLAEVFARAEEEEISVPGDPEVAAALLLGFLNEAAGLIAAAPSDRALRGRVGDRWTSSSRGSSAEASSVEPATRGAIAVERRSGQGGGSHAAHSRGVPCPISS